MTWKQRLEIPLALWKWFWIWIGWGCVCMSIGAMCIGFGWRRGKEEFKDLVGGI